MSPTFDLQIVGLGDVLDVHFVQFEPPFNSSVVFYQLFLDLFLSLQFYLGLVVDGFALEDVYSHEGGGLNAGGHAFFAPFSEGGDGVLAVKGLALVYKLVAFVSALIYVMLFAILPIDFGKRPNFRSAVFSSLLLIKHLLIIISIIFI